VKIASFTDKEEEEEEEKWDDIYSEEEEEEEEEATLDTQRTSTGTSSSSRSSVPSTSASTSSTSTSASSSSSKLSSFPLHSWRWLKSRLEKFASYDPTTGAPLISETELTIRILLLLRSNKNNEQLGAEMIDLLGFDGFDLIQEFLQNRNQLKQIDEKSESKQEEQQMLTREALSSSSSSSSASSSSSNSSSSSSSASAAAMPSHFKHLVGVSINSQHQKNLDRIRRREERKMARKSTREIKYDEYGKGSHTLSLAQYYAHSSYTTQNYVK